MTSPKTPDVFASLTRGYLKTHSEKFAQWPVGTEHETRVILPSQYAGMSTETRQQLHTLRRRTIFSASGGFAVGAVGVWQAMESFATSGIEGATGVAWIAVASMLPFVFVGYRSQYKREDIESEHDLSRGMEEFMIPARVSAAFHDFTWHATYVRGANPDPATLVALVDQERYAEDLTREAVRLTAADLKTSTQMADVASEMARVAAETVALNELATRQQRAVRAAHATTEMVLGARPDSLAAAAAEVVAQTELAEALSDASDLDTITDAGMIERGSAAQATRDHDERLFGVFKAATSAARSMRARIGAR